MTSTAKIEELQAKLRLISSALGMLKGDLEDEGCEVASEATEQAQDAVDDAIGKLTAACRDVADVIADRAAILSDTDSF